MRTFFLSLIATGIVFVTMIPLFNQNLFRVHDYLQGARLAEMKRSFSEGQVPVRWSGNFGFGYGMPTFLFYAPFPYYVGTFAYWVTGSLLVGLQILWLVPSVFSFLGMYLFARRYVEQWGSLVVAASFTLAPYRAVDLYVRGAIGEVWGIMLIPWLCLATLRLSHRPTLSRALQLGILISILLTTHNLIAMLFMPFLIGYGKYIGWIKWMDPKTRAESIKFLKLSVLSNFIGLGLAAYFVIPALMEKGFTQIEEQILSRYFHYSQHFLYIRQFFQDIWRYGGSNWGPNDDMSFFLGYGQLVLMTMTVLLLAGLSVIALKKYLSQGKVATWAWAKEYLEANGVIGITILSFMGVGISLFMTLLKSEFIWNAIPFFITIQFPWRFLSLAIFFISLSHILVFKMISNPVLKKVVATVCIFAFLIPSFRYFQPEIYLDNLDAFYFDDPEKIEKELSGIWPDFLPLGVSTDHETKLDFAEEVFQVYLREVKNVDATVLIDRSHQVVLRTDETEPVNFIFQTFDFPGWQAYVDGVKVPHVTTPDGLIEVAVDAGKHIVTIHFGRTNVRMIADLITGMSIFVVLGLYIYEMMRYRTHE